MANEKTKFEKLKEKAEESKEKIKKKAKEVDKFVKEKPYRSLSIVAGTSALLGAVAAWFLMRKKK